MTIKLTPSMLRRIIKEEVDASVKGSPTDFNGVVDAALADMDRRAADRRWEALSRRFPKATSRVGREAFDAEMHRREEGAAGGGSSYGGPAAEFGTLLGLLEKA